MYYTMKLKFSYRFLVLECQLALSVRRRWWRLAVRTR